MKCRHCNYKSDNPEIFNHHELHCIENQVQNGLIAEHDSGENEVDYSSMTVEQLKAMCKEKGLEGYSNLNKDDLVAFIKENIKG